MTGGFDAARLARIDAWLPGAIARSRMPGATVMLARHGQVHVATTGVRDIASGAPMTRDTIVRIASMTKAITTVAVLMLVEEGRIALDDPIDPWLPELADRRVLRALDGPVDDTVPADRPITLRDLMTFRAGHGAIMARPGTYPIQAVLDDLGVAPGFDAIDVDPDTFMARLGSVPLLHQPGERWLYHTGNDILSVLIARIEGEPLPDVLARRIFAPLGMADTGFEVPADKQARFATCYVGAGDGFAISDRPDGQFGRPQVFPTELVSTADDYRTFATMLLRQGEGPDGRLLSRAAVALMTSDQIPAAVKAVSFFPGLWEGGGWGMGGRVVTARTGIGPGPGAYGWSGGCGTHYLIDPAEDLFVTVLTQRVMQNPDDDRIARELVTLAYAAIDD